MYKLYFDGGKKRDTVSFGCVIYNAANEVKYKFGGALPLSQLTSNAAEYLALIIGLVICLSHDIKDVEVYGDSQIIINHMTGISKSKSPSLYILYKITQSLAVHFNDISYCWIPREMNGVAHREGK